MQEYVVICEWAIERVTFPGHWQGKVEVLGRKPAPVPIYPPQTLYSSLESNPGIYSEKPATSSILPWIYGHLTSTIRNGKILHRLQNMSVG